MNVINFGSILLDPETAVLFVAAAFLAWLFRATRLAACCGVCGVWLAFAPWLDPLFAQAFEHVPVWVPMLIISYVAWSFLSSVVDLFAGRGAMRRLAARAVRLSAGWIGKGLLCLPVLLGRAVTVFAIAPFVLMRSIIRLVLR